MLISGEAGIGKSRLVAELKRAVGEAWHLCEGRCFEQDRALPYALLMELTNATVINPANEPAASLLTEQDKRKFFDAMAETLLPSQ